MKVSFNCYLTLSPLKPNEILVPLPPPPYTETDTVGQSPTNDVPKFQEITEDEVKESLLQFVNETCCYGKGALAKIVIKGMEMKSSFHLSLASFTESRQTKWVSVPYNGQPIMVSGGIPRPWDVYLPPPVPFCENKSKAEVPNSARVQGCTTCARSGVIRCISCRGGGRDECNFCNGTMTQFNERCRHCTNGFKMCTFCHGSGRKTCHTCNGSGQMKWFLELKVVWKNHVNDAFSDETGLPQELMLKVAGKNSFLNWRSHFSPITFSHYRTTSCK